MTEEQTRKHTSELLQELEVCVCHCRARSFFRAQSILCLSLYLQHAPRCLDFHRNLKALGSYTLTDLLGRKGLPELQMVTRLYIERVPGVRAFETLPLFECLTDKL